MTVLVSLCGVVLLCPSAFAFRSFSLWSIRVSGPSRALPCVLGAPAFPKGLGRASRVILLPFSFSFFFLLLLVSPLWSLVAFPRDSPRSSRLAREELNFLGMRRSFAAIANLSVTPARAFLDAGAEAGAVAMEEVCREGPVVLVLLRRFG